ncbi:hypothetical protein CRG98_023305 [Punica granatum]|uniref:Uncharacterized protein n=1 Tax=Punica granatum TaxID=22663 RepID=A0A2I0JL58_PUNGR|nr:hypothetical protein CRG98_023305 [Punica granatum]
MAYMEVIEHDYRYTQFSITIADNSKFCRTDNQLETSTTFSCRADISVSGKQLALSDSIPENKTSTRPAQKCRRSNKTVKAYRSISAAEGSHERSFDKAALLLLLWVGDNAALRRTNAGKELRRSESHRCNARVQVGHVTLLFGLLGL